MGGATAGVRPPDRTTHFERIGQAIVAAGMGGVKAP